MQIPNILVVNFISNDTCGWESKRSRRNIRYIFVWGVNSFSVLSNFWKTRCRHNGTYWPAVQCRPSDRPRARQRYNKSNQIKISYLTCPNQSRQRAKQYWPIRWASNNTE